MNYAIEVKDLKKSYGTNNVLKGLNFKVKQGETFAILGVNGAGKTTTLECIEGLRGYSSGQIAVNGKIGIQLQSSSLPGQIQPMEAVQLFAKWNRVKVDKDMLHALGVDDLGKKQYDGMSTGQKRRLHLALALLNDPDIIFLDEPTAGLDVEGRISLHEEIVRLKAEGRTIILASHDMAEVEALCDRVAILKDGEIAFIGTPEELIAKIGRRCTIIVKTEQGEDRFETDQVSDAMLNLLTQYRERDIAVLDIKVDKGTLEQHFIHISRGTDA